MILQQICQLLKLVVSLKKVLLPTKFPHYTVYTETKVRLWGFWCIGQPNKFKRPLG